MSTCTYELLVVNDHVQLIFSQKDGPAGFLLLLTAAQAEKLASAIGDVARGVK